MPYDCPRIGDQVVINDFGWQMMPGIPLKRGRIYTIVSVSPTRDQWYDFGDKRCPSVEVEPAINNKTILSVYFNKRKTMKIPKKASDSGWPLVLTVFNSATQTDEQYVRVRDGELLDEQSGAANNVTYVKLRNNKADVTQYYSPFLPATEEPDEVRIKLLKMTPIGGDTPEDALKFAADIEVRGLTPLVVPPAFR